MSPPHSLLDACKIVAECADIPWAKANPIYRALQQEDRFGGPWLPLSRGRAILAAQPSLVATFFIALCTSDGPDVASANVLRFAYFTEGGMGAQQADGGAFAFPTTLRDKIADALRWGWSDEQDPLHLSGLAGLEFELDEDPAGVAVNSFDGKGGLNRSRFEDSARDWGDLNLLPKPERQSASRMIRRRIHIDGRLAQEIAARISWPASGVVMVRDAIESEQA